MESPFFRWQHFLWLASLGFGVGCADVEHPVPVPQQVEDPHWFRHRQDSPIVKDPFTRFSTGADERESLTFDTDAIQVFQDSGEAKLDLSDYQIGREEGRRIGGLTNLQWLRVPKTVSAQDLDWITSPAALRGVSIRYADLSGADFSLFGKLKELQWLDLDGAAYSEDDFSKLARLPKLETLYLSRTVTDSMIEHLVSLRLPKLKNVRLRAGKISDAGLENLCSEYDLIYLDIASISALTSNSVEVLGREGSLCYVDVMYTGFNCNRYGMPTDDIRRLDKLLPTCNIQYWD